VRYIAYTRVSTFDQAEDGHGLDAQWHKIGLWSQLNEHDIVGHITEAASGKSAEARPELQRALSMLRRGEADGVVVAKLDRLSRSVKDFATLLEEFQGNGWSLSVLDLQVDLGTPVGKLVAGILSAVAEFEREIIVERTKAGMAAAKAKGIHLGRPKKGKP
jgi:DNA invertase Pin-like site-specific DNA recombinase